mmetsp:Transcript_9238/g.16283  ORF Transcript_9238/g.16283 Transcript_9238/m.16283 type:complete len:379 (+) Transcript_9238:118-1254(+)
MPEVLDWESGVSRCLTSLEEDLIRWNAEERKKLSEQQLQASKAEKDLAAVEAAVCRATPDFGKDVAWQDRLASLVRTAKEQRAVLRDFCALLRRRARNEAPELLKELPEDTVPEKLQLQRLTTSILGIVDKNASAEAPDQEEDAPEDSAAPDENEQDAKRERRKKPARKASKREVGEKPKKRAKVVKEKEDEEEVDDYSEDYDDYSYSKTPSPKPRRRRRGAGGGGGGAGGGRRAPPEKPRRRRQKRRPSPSVYSRDYSYTPPPERRPRGRGARRHRGRREDGGGGGGGGGGSRDLASEIDRFVRVNKLEDRCEKILRDLDPRKAKEVMGLSGGNNTFELSGDVRDPTAVVLARVRKAREGGARGGGRRGGRRRSPDR